MKIAKFRSDYDPTCILTLIKNDDGDIIIDVNKRMNATTGEGECRIAMSGGTLHGDEKVRIVKAFEEIIDVLNAREDYRK